MIKETLINSRESFFIQSFLLLLPTLIFSRSLSLSLILGGASLLFIYLMALSYYLLIPFLKREYRAPTVIGIIAFFSVSTSALTYYLYGNYYLSHAYLVNLFLISLFTWHKNIFKNRTNISEVIKKDLPISLAWIYLFLVSFSFLKEILETGGMSLFGFSFYFIPSGETLSNLNINLGNFIVLFLVLLSLRLLPSFYPKGEEEKEASKNLEKEKKSNESLLEKTKRLESLLNEGLPQK